MSEGMRQAGFRGKPRGVRGPIRARHVRVRVQTDQGMLIGNVRLAYGHSIYELLDDERAYLVLFGVTYDDSREREEFVAIHKGAIRSVVLDVGNHRAVAAES